MKKIKVTKNGPYVVSGNLPLDNETMEADETGVPCRWRKDGEIKTDEEYALCRCGKSKDKPFCDGSHSTGFDGEETANDTKYYDAAEKIDGEELDLYDRIDLCASGRFCDGGIGAWSTAENSGDPENKKLATDECCNCPSGRLVLHDKKTGKEIEPKFEESISAVLDEEAGVNGPLWVKGGVEIESADGKKYEKRNRVTLCRCGKSKNKPFCDASHLG